MLMQMVRGNYKGYMEKELLQAKEACQMQAMIGNPSKGDYKKMVSSNMIFNCPITAEDVTKAVISFDG